MCAMKADRKKTLIENQDNGKYVIDPKARKRLLYKKIFNKYLMKYIAPSVLLYLFAVLIKSLINLETPVMAILFMILMVVIFNIEHDLGNFMADDAVYASNITFETRHGVYKLPNSIILLAIPYIDKIIDYIKDTKKHNLLFKTSVENSIDKNIKNTKRQEIVFYTCNFCTRLIIDIDRRMIIETSSYVSFDMGFLNGFDYHINIYDDTGHVIEDMPKYKINCFKSTISEAILGEDIDILCYNNRISVFDFLRSFFFAYWLAETYLLYNTDRKVLI
jgi:hypothetical protein